MTSPAPELTSHASEMTSPAPEMTSSANVSSPATKVVAADPPVADPPVAEQRSSAGHRRVTARLRGAWARVPGRWKFVVGLFLAAKVIVMLAATLAVHAFDGVFARMPEPLRQDFAGQTLFPSNRALSMWFAWDSIHYTRLVEQPVSGPGSDVILQFCFPPLYPLLGKLVAPLVGGNAALALFLISNAGLLMLLYYAYRLAERMWGDEASARRFTRYVVLLPTAFLFQAALTESLFLCLVLACFYYAEGGNWLLAGILGCFASLTRSMGFLVVIPLVVLLLHQGGYRLRPGALLRYLRVGWPLVLVPGGWLLFLAYAKVRTGDWLRYQHLQESRWRIHLQNPVRFMAHAMVHPATGAGWLRIAFAVGYLLLMVVAVGYLRPAYVVYGVIFTLVPLSIGASVYTSILRYLLVIFPVALLCARWGRRPGVDVYLTAGLALAQGILLVAWANTWANFIV